MKNTRNKYHLQIRKCRRVEEYLRNQKIIENCLENDTELFSEIKKQRGGTVDEDITVDGTSGENIPKTFATIYSGLFNRVNDDDNMNILMSQIKQSINEDDIYEVEKVNESLVKEAVEKLKPNKSDPLWDFSTDFLKGAPDILFYHISEVFKAFLVHGHVSKVLLLAALVPLVKDKLADLCTSSNYRSIAISSIFLKLLDCIILKAYGHLLKLDELQFGFQENNSTSLCSWFAFETIDHYIRKGSIVYGVLMDCTKAFDTVKHSKLFAKLLDAKVPTVVVRLLIFIYRTQMAEVRWKQFKSEEFPLRNGVRQGAILSPILFCFYMNNLFDMLRKTRSGCYVGNFFAGILGYADDLLLLSPSREGLQQMVSIAENYAAEHNISFSTHSIASKSKTKGMIFSRKELKWNPEPIVLCGNKLPWVKDAKYLGNIITNIYNGMEKDVLSKRAKFIEKNCEIIQEFKCAHPEVKTKVNKSYNSSFPGSVLWSFSGRSVEKLVNSWSVAIRHMWELPVNSHRYLVEELGGPHAKSMLYSRFISFLQSIKRHSKFPVQYLLCLVKDDAMSNTGLNVKLILNDVDDTDILKIDTTKFKKNYCFAKMKKEDLWRAEIIRELINVKQGVLQFQGFNGDDNFLTNDQIQEIIDYVSTS